MDKKLVNSEWYQSGNWSIKSLSRKHSDHSPLFVFQEGMVREFKPFRIFNYFLTDELLEEVQKWMISDNQWKKLNIHVALKKIKERIKDKTRGTKDKMDVEIRRLEDNLQMADNNTKAQDWRMQGGNKREVVETLLQERIHA